MTLTKNQKRALEAVLVYPRIRDAARACGLSRNTIYKYLATPAFKAELTRHQDVLVIAATAALANQTGEAVSALADALVNPDSTPAVRTRAAQGILRAVLDLINIRDIIIRLEALEAKQDD